MKVHVFGSHYEGDDVAFKVAEILKNEYDFLYPEDPSSLLDEDNLVIMDAVKGIKKVKLFVDLDDIKGGGINSLHDFDLGYFLKLSERLGVKKKIFIVGLPMEGDFKIIVVDAREQLLKLKGSSYRHMGRH